MNSYQARVEVKLKPGHVDSEGLTTEKALNDMDYSVEEVSTAKVFEIKLTASSLEEAESEIKDMCKKLLANPVKDDYKVEVEKAE
ncbi:hypothetical protein AKJ53_00285 [candidate division MSBL1 archaeon SCGC-AAA382F02]|uniref:Phosphoribosylformylglycinamidine synthase subunit PurS n=1 Tax=candidate division MSBL1 archaeon SCGC-AAA382F02 TaxID=1698282 RepID=A0A133VJ90_9EURY|nr:hypothetical protein AKJ53_00285 [candidate division MSBL1 archaeon SCGC-AAA382F02]